MNKKLRYGIIGGGAAGCALAWQLTQNGHDVHVFERERGLGGLASEIAFGKTSLDRFYHHIFTSDLHVLKYIERTGLTPKLNWCDSSVGFEHQGKLFPFTTPIHLLRFSPLSLWSRFRLGLAILRMQRRDDYRELESITAEDFIIQAMGEQSYRVLWEPLLRSKFGDRYREVSAVWFWGKIKLRGGTRSNKGGECLGYLKDGWAQLYHRMGEHIQERGGSIHLGQMVRNIRRDENGTLWVKTRSGEEGFDRVIVTPSTPTFLQLTPDLPDDYRESVNRIPYQANICMVLGLDRSLSPYYWLNITAPDSPFVAIIEHTRLFHDPDYEGVVPVYLTRYLSDEDPLFTMRPKDAKELFFEHLQKVFPDFSEDWVQSFTYSKALYAQPVVGLGYSSKRPAFQTPIPGLYLCTMAQIYPEDRGQNYSIKMAEELLGAIGEEVD